MMEGLQLWKKFEKLKSRACNKAGFFYLETEVTSLSYEKRGHPIFHSLGWRRHS